MDAAKQIDQSLYKAALACRINGKLQSLPTALHEGDELEILTWEDEDGRWTLRHTASHVLAQAVAHLYPEVKFAIGPAIDNGFYYDFDREIPFTAEDLTAIEAEMKKIVKQGIRLERFELPRAEALKFMVFERWSHFLSVSERKSHNSLFSISRRLFSYLRSCKVFAGFLPRAFGIPCTSFFRSLISK